MSDLDVQTKEKETSVQKQIFEAVDALQKETGDYKAQSKAQFSEAISKFNDLHVEFQKEKTAREAAEKLNLKLQEDLEALKQKFFKMERSREGQLFQAQEKQDEFKKAYVEFLRKGDRNSSFQFSQYTTSINPLGGFLVPDPGISDVQTRQFDYSNVDSVARTLQVSSPIYKTLLRDQKLQGVKVIKEGGAIPQAQLAEMGIAEIQSQTMAIHVDITNDMLRDSSLDIGQIVSQMAIDEMNTIKNYSALYGKGVNSTDPCKGMLTYTPFISETFGDYQRGSIQARETTASGTLDFDSLRNFIVGTLRSRYRPNATLAMNMNTLSEILGLKDGDDRYIFNPTALQASVANGLSFPFLGVSRLAIWDDLPTVAEAAAGSGNEKVFIMYGDFARAYTFIQLGGIEVKTDMMPQDASGNTVDATRYVFRTSIGGGITNFDALKVLRVKA